MTTSDPFCAASLAGSVTQPLPAGADVDAVFDAYRAERARLQKPRRLRYEPDYPAGRGYWKMVDDETNDVIMTAITGRPGQR